MIHRLFVCVLTLALSVTACAELPFEVEEIASFHNPWALAFLPDGRMLVSEQAGSLFLVDQEGNMLPAVGGLPDVDYGGQGGFGDVALHPGFEENALVYISYVEGGAGGTRGAAVARGVFEPSGRRPTLNDVEVIWRQYPKVIGRGHFGHRMLFDDDGYLWITSGDRQKFMPAQDMQASLGKILRLNDDGSVPEDNPFVGYRSTDPLVGDPGVYDQIWALGVRNPLGIAQDSQGRIWEVEMGPAHGDELNLIERGANYGYPHVSNGNHYDGREIPNHESRPDFSAPKAWWDPTIAPGDLMIYQGGLFDEWRGNALVAGLASHAIIRVELSDDGSARELERFPMGERIRSVVQGPDGAIWVLEDGGRTSGGRLLKLTPAK